MAMGKQSDFVIYHEQFYGGVTEGINQNINVFNEASQGALQMVTQDLIGDYAKESFFKDINGLISRRDLTSVAVVGDTPMQQDEVISVKVNRKIGPVSHTLNAFRKLGADPEEMSFKLGEMVGRKKMKDMVNTGIRALVGAIINNANVIYDATADTLKTANHTALVGGLAKFGDMSGSIRAWVMHSKNYHDLMKQGIADKIFEVAGVTIYEGTIATFNRPVIVVDCPDLVVTADTPDSYYTLGLAEGALVLTESEEQDIVAQIVTGQEQLGTRVQGEYAFNLEVLGYKWDTTTGGPNPTDAALVTAGNWDKVAYDDKLTAGIAIKFQ